MSMQSTVRAARVPRRRVWAERAAECYEVCAQPVAMAVCACVFSLVQWFGIPAPYAAAYLIAQNARGYQAIFPLMGLAASAVLRLCWGQSPDWPQLVGCALTWLSLRLVKLRKPRQLVLLAGLSALPAVIAGLIAPDWSLTPQAIAAVPVCMGVTLWLRRGLDALQAAQPSPSLADRACCALPALLLIAGFGYMRVVSVNLGYALGALGTLAVAFTLGGASGGAAGLLIGLSLALSGHDCRLALAFGLGGWMAGLLAIRRRRWLSALGLLAGNLLAFFLTPLTAPILPFPTAIAGCVAFLLLGQGALKRVRALASASPVSAKGSESAFVQTRLDRCEAALRAMAVALPTITENSLAIAGARSLAEQVCTDCAERPRCHGPERERTERFFGELWSAALKGEEAFDARLAACRGDGCLRLHAISEAAEEALRGHRARLNGKAKARFQREMTATHLDAMAETVASLRRIACGETLSDLQATYQMERSLHELHFPAELRYARRVDGRLYAALDCDPLSPHGRQPDRLLRQLAKDAGLQLRVSRIVKNRIELEEIPLYSVELGVASLCAGGQTEHEAVSGDAIAVRQLPGGRYLLSLHDGMGHGERAGDESRRSLELLMLTLEAGYTRRQAITAVNGMMLSATDEDRFTTVDLFDLDLWTGEVRNEKLGAAPSFIVRGNYIKRVEGSSLPLGILESVAPTSHGFRLHSGDILVIVSDGVADVFPEPHAAERAIADSLFIQPQRMADALLRAALLASGGTPRDDMTVAALLLVVQRRSATVED